jgi:hypothetical protein
MAIPRQTFTIRDPGLGVSGQSENTFLFVGCSETGDLNLVQSISSPNRALSVFGRGPLTRDLCHALLVSGGPVYACRVAGTTPGAAGSVNKTSYTSSSGTLTTAGASYDRFDAIIEIMATGTLGAGRFRYSLDNGRAFTEELTIPGSGTYLMPNTNITLTFAPGAGPIYFERGDRHTFTAAAPHYGTNEVGLACDALAAYLSTAPEAVFHALYLTGRNATGSGAATLFGALSVRLAGLFNQHRFLGAIMDAGSGDTYANVKAALAAVADTRICAVYGDADIVAGDGYSGLGAPKNTAALAVATRALSSLISTDLARFADGALTGVLKIYHDEYLTEEMDSAKISTLRTWPGQAGFYITNAWMKSPAGSDFRYWQHRRCMDEACTETVAKQQLFANISVAVTEKGFIEESEAKSRETVVRRGLENKLLLPKNIEGSKGHVSAIGYTIRRDVDVLRTETLETEVFMRPRGYVKTLSTTLGFAANV